MSAQCSSSSVGISARFDIDLVDNATHNINGAALLSPPNFTPTAGNGEVLLSWDAVYGADSYVIIYGESGVDLSSRFIKSDVTEVTGLTGTSTTITGLTNLTTYDFAIYAVTDEGLSSPVSPTTSSTPEVGASYASINLDGVDEHMTLPNTYIGSALNGESTCSVNIWYKRGTTGSEQYLYQAGGANYYLHLSINASNTFNFGASPGGGDSFSYSASSAAYPDTTSWHMATLVVSIATDTVSLYVDGVLDKTATGLGWTNTVFTSLASAATYIGRRHNGVYWNGHLDHMGVWTTALGAAEVAALYNSGAPVHYSSNSGSYVSSGDLINYWRMGEGDTHPTLLDSAGSDDMTMVNTEAGDIDTTDYAGI
jgi:hypothetical protein